MLSYEQLEAKRRNILLLWDPLTDQLDQVDQELERHPEAAKSASSSYQFLSGMAIFVCLLAFLLALMNHFEDEDLPVWNRQRLQSGWMELQRRVCSTL